MIVSLPVAEAPEDGVALWNRFLLRRADLTARMDLTVCNHCDGCGTRCTDGFLVTQEEDDAARDYFASLPAAERERIERQPKILPWPVAEDDADDLKETGATVTYCRYRDLERGRCSIYPARPTICRLFGQTNWLPCPIGAITDFPPDAATFWNDYRRFPRRTWSEWDAMSVRAVRVLRQTAVKRRLPSLLSAVIPNRSTDLKKECPGVGANTLLLSYSEGKSRASGGGYCLRNGRRAIIPLGSAIRRGLGETDCAMSEDSEDKVYPYAISPKHFWREALLMS